jgi:signal peptidase I
MARLLTALGLLGLLAFLSLSFDGAPGALAKRRRAGVSAEVASPDPADGPDTEETEPSSKQPGDQAGPVRRRRFRLRVRTVLSWLLYLALVVGAIVAIPRVLSWALGTPQPLAAVSGSSMWPTLHKGDLVLLKGVDGMEDLQVGDIIAFRQERGFSIHRVVNIEGEMITTRGDGNFGDDPPITIDDVMGKVPQVWGRLARVPFLGNLSLIFGPAVRRDNDFRPQEERPLSQPVPDLAEEDTGRILGPVDDLSKQRLADESEASPSAPEERRPVPDLREEGQALDSTATTGSPVEDLAPAKQ